MNTTEENLLAKASMRVLRKPKEKPLPDYGDHMTWESFKAHCESGLFMDYDGTALAATATGVLIPRTEIYPSWTAERQYKTPPSHVVWFNK